MTKFFGGRRTAATLLNDLMTARIRVNEPDILANGGGAAHL